MERGADGAVVLDVGGVGYDVSVPLGALGKLPSAPEPVTLHVHTHVREDAFSLFGFASAEDRAAFRVLLGISSVGPKLALAILSHLDAGELARAVAREDGSRFKGIPGVGKKIADRLLLELRDKVGFLATAGSGSSSGSVAAPFPSGGAPAFSGALGQVHSALIGMGFKPSEAERAVTLISKSAEGKAVDALLREALGGMA